MYQVIPQVRMFLKAEDRTNSFVMLRRKKHLRKQTITRYGTGSVISRSLSVSKCGNMQGDWLRRAKGCSLRFARLQAAFRIDRLTSNVPYAVRFVLRNDNERIMFNYSQKQLL